MDRRRSVGALAVGLIAVRLHAEAQQAGTVRRIGRVGGDVPEYIEAREEGLRRLGWIEDKTLASSRCQQEYEPTHKCRSVPGSLRPLGEDRPARAHSTMLNSRN